MLDAGCWMIWHVDVGLKDCRIGGLDKTQRVPGLQIINQIADKAVRQAESSPKAPKSRLI